ncbi:hypothetical protein DU502_11760 [Haloplanus aerogenes]|uniref:Uncharacterized protein n=1 Tax=Haloplanus aerogenes TaxID=660522 RepID=A0A3G8QX00_9EURY|nr:hypothetical protein DU502_11760 [Haloplanus aerogenes]
MVMRLLTPVVLITPVITTTLKYPDAVGEARMLQSAQEDASPRVEPPRTGFEISLTLLSRGRGYCEGQDRYRTNDLHIYRTVGEP